MRPVSLRTEILSTQLYKLVQWCDYNLMSVLLLLQPTSQRDSIGGYERAIVGWTLWPRSCSRLSSVDKSAPSQKQAGKVDEPHYFRGDSFDCKDSQTASSATCVLYPKKQVREIDSFSFPQSMQLHPKTNFKTSVQQVSLLSFCSYCRILNPTE